MLSPESFQEYLFTVCKYRKGAALLAAVSGGLDSVVLIHLLHQNNIPFGIAHVNYGLRGKESDEDEKFVAALAQKYNVPFILKKCNAEDFSNTEVNSIQFAARKIRYAFFEETSIHHGYSFIATAHHLDDSIETALLNFARGTGVSGLRSIQAVNEKIIRPLLFVSRKEISDYSEKNKLEWREDSSNKSDKYSRNKFRHHLLPWLMNEIPQHYSGFKSSFEQLKETEELLNYSIAFWKQEFCIENENEIKIGLESSENFPGYNLFLRFYLRKNGFSDAQLFSLENILNGNAGTQLISGTSKLIRDRNHLYLISDYQSKNIAENNFHFTEESFNGEILNDFFSAMVDVKTIVLPFTIRKWQAGDKIIPVGMKGQKKVSDILNEMKLPLHKKENAKVILSGDEIVWIPGYRIAEKFKVTKETSRIYKLSYKNE